MPGSLSRMKGQVKKHLGAHSYKEDDVYIEREELNAYPRAEIMLMRPETAQMLREATVLDSVARANLPDFTNITHVFIPVNDHQDTGTEGGSHWSLVLVSLIDGVCFHYDSGRGSPNTMSAQRTVHRLGQTLEKTLRFINMNDYPKQDNGSDCGVFVCLAMRHLLFKRLLRADSSEKISMSMRDQDINAAAGRKVLLELIHERRSEAKEIMRRS
ncbi:hypothetical protein N0V90_003230 [Kalmusia sp. IMI 367209]|nr:hypothetical protein N0V90_003230 [Kalmusia sp. IMI 367209]